MAEETVGASELAVLITEEVGPYCMQYKRLRMIVE